MNKLFDDNQPHHCRVACRDRAGVERNLIFSKRRQTGGEQRVCTILSTCVCETLDTLLRV